MKARFIPKLVRDAQKLRRTRRFKLNVDFLLLLHDAREHVFILLRTQRLFFNRLGASRRHEEEEMMCLGANLDGKIRHGLKFALIPVHDCRMNLERESDGTAVLHTLYGTFPTAGEAAEFIMLGWVERIKRDAHRTGTGFLELLRHVKRNQRAVRAKDRNHMEVRSVFDELEDVGAHQRLAARENHDFKTGFGNLAQEFLALFGAEFFLSLAACLTVAVGTVHIAGICRVPRDDFHFFSSVSPISSSVR